MASVVGWGRLWESVQTDNSCQRTSDEKIEDPSLYETSFCHGTQRRQIWFLHVKENGMYNMNVI